MKPMTSLIPIRAAGVVAALVLAGCDTRDDAASADKGAQPARLSDRAASADRDRRSVGTPRSLAEAGGGSDDAGEEPELDAMGARMLEHATSGFEQTREDLGAGLGLGAAQAARVDEILDRRAQAVARHLARLSSAEGGGDEVIRRLCGLVRNQGLREDLAGVLSPEQLEAFDAEQAKTAAARIEARAYQDMAVVNEVVGLSQEQKAEVLGTLMKAAPAKVEEEADARAYMTLHYGALAEDMESSSIRALATMMNEGYLEPDSEAYQSRSIERKAERIERELAALRGILDDAQLGRYREHLEAELPR